MIARIVLLSACASCVLSAACIAVSGDQIVAADLVGISPAFKDLNPRLTFSYSPVPGKQRTIGANEINSWALNNQVSNFSQTEPVCFERTGRSLTADEISKAILQNFSTQHPPTVEILEFTRTILATGHVEFPRSGAGSSPTQSNSPVLWRGRIIDEKGTSIPVWARLRITVEQSVLRFKQPLPMGHVLSDSDLEQAVVQVCALGPATAPERSWVVGQSLRRSVQAGMIIAPDLVQPTPDISKGDIVQVEVVSGSARINFDAKAETSGRIGDYITLTNPSGTERFKAKIVTATSVQVIVTPRQGNSARG